MSKDFVVSDEFLDIYQNFNVCSQVEKMKLLSRRELLLLLIISIDTFPFSMKNASYKILRNNYNSFKDEVSILHSSLPDLGQNDVITDIDIISLGHETGDKWADISKIVDKYKNILPKTLNEEEASIKRRDIGIDIILKNK